MEFHRWSRVEPHQNGGFFRATEIPPHEMVTATMRFSGQRTARDGQCHLQMELLIGRDFHNNWGDATVHTLVADLKTE